MSIAKAGETDRLRLSDAEGFHCSGSFQAKCKEKPTTQQSLKFSAVSSTLSPGRCVNRGAKSDFGNGRASRLPRCGARGPTARAVGKNAPSPKAQSVGQNCGQRQFPFAASRLRMLIPRPTAEATGHL